MSNSKLKDKVEFEISQIDELFSVYNSLLAKSKIEKPNLIETTAISSILQSFYNGIENIMSMVIKNIDEILIRGEHSHKDILDLSIIANEKRKAIITKEISYQLDDYRSFRHFCRHSYSFILSWEKMEPLVLSLDAIWEELKGQIGSFITTI